MAWFSSSKRDREQQSYEIESESQASRDGAVTPTERDSPPQQGQYSLPTETVRRVLGLLRFLKEMAELGARPVRDINSYESRLWLDELIDTLGCHSPRPGELWPKGADVWIEVTKQSKPDAPPPPDICLPWIDGDYTKEEQEPTLREHIRASEVWITNDDQVPVQSAPGPSKVQPPDSSPNEEDGLPDGLPFGKDESGAIKQQLEDHPEVMDAWNCYLAAEWRPWVDACVEWRRSQEIYRKLFEIHQTQQRLGESYELVVGFGLLVWNTEKDGPIRRHLICADVELELDSDRGQFTVRPSSEGPKLRVELDMIPVASRPAQLEDEMKGLVDLAEDAPWGSDAIERALRSAAQSLHEDGSFDGTFAKAKASSTVPRVHTAPAMILRKRSTRGLIQTINQIQTDIEQSGRVTPLLETAVETTRTTSTNGYDGKTQQSIPQAIYMPLPTNDQQVRIVERAEHSRGVLVQGPPGTGKSHTIANLICHLLATGNRVLVTAQTPRALQVLVGDEKNSGKLPGELRPLCVGLMGRSRDELESLGRSVNGILAKRESWDRETSCQQIRRLEETLDELRVKAARLSRNLRHIRERESYEHILGDGMYRGTMATIARQLDEQRVEFDWFMDTPSSELPPEAGLGPKLYELVELYQQISQDVEGEIALRHPSREELPSVDEFRRLARRECDAKAEEERYCERGQWGEQILGLSMDTIDQLGSRAEMLAAKVEQVLQRQVQWAESALKDVLAEHETPWRELLERSADLIDGLRDRARLADRTSIQHAPAELDTESLLFEANRLVGHIECGGFLQWKPFKRRPAAVRRAVKQFRHARVGGRPCEDASSLPLLIERLETELAVRRLVNLWENKISLKQSGMADQVAEIEEHHEVLQSILEIFELRGSAQAEVQKSAIAPAPRWSELAQVQELIASARFAGARAKQALIQSAWEEISAVVQCCAGSHSHPYNLDLEAIIETRNEQKYAAIRAKLEELWSQAEALSRRQELEQLLTRLMPKLIAAVRTAPADPRWKTRSESLEDAWRWASARDALQKLVDADDADLVEDDYRKTTATIQKTIESLAAEKAWAACFTSMNDFHASHLKAWRQAVKSVGKGTGKHAEKHRKDARKHLEACREAVPAWVMPLHRLYESITARPGMFDVAIVDEASQCAHDALLLMYLAKRVIIVGDDQQISPPAGYVDGDDVDFLMRKYLPELNHQDGFRKGKSLYDLAERWFGDSIVLREHFRCVPEIIKFSNDLCYRDRPLIALRQDTPRLDPLVYRLIESGYREGKSQPINKPEAESLVDAMVDCCADERYEGKSMGVISLQGSAQAAYVENLLLDRLGAEEIARRRIVCGDAYAFQGDERHVVFLTMVAAPNERIGVLTKEEDKRRFNVAASRAQDQMWLFHTATMNDLNPQCMRRKLLSFFHDSRGSFEKSTGVSMEEIEGVAAAGRRPGSQPPPFDSWFEIDVARRIVQAGYRVLPQFAWAGYHVDLMIEGELNGNIRRLAVECDGDKWHGPERFNEDMHRQRQLERAGLQFCRIRESVFYANPDKAMRPLWAAAEIMGFGPPSLS